MIARSLRVYVCALLFPLLAAGCGRQPYESGNEVYQGECVKCHKMNGQGGEKGPELTDILSKKDEDYVRRYTIDPRSIKPDSTMPPAKLSDRELDLLIEFLQRHGLADKTE